MKKYINYTVMLIALLTMGFTFNACGDDEEKAYIKTIGIDELVFPASGQTVMLYVTSNVDWEITGYPEWITVSTTHDKWGDGSVSVQIEASKNESTIQREGTLILTGSGVSHILPITQKGWEKQFSSIVGTYALSSPFDYYEYYCVFNEDGTYRYIYCNRYGRESEKNGQYTFNQFTGELIMTSDSKEESSSTWIVTELGQYLKMYEKTDNTKFEWLYERYYDELPEQYSLSKIIVGSWVCINKHFEYITFNPNGKVTFQLYTNDLLAKYDIEYRGVEAEGTYTVNENYSEVEINLSNVKVNYAGGEYHGYKHGESASIVLELNTQSLIANKNELVFWSFANKKDDVVERIYIPMSEYEPMVYGKDVTGQSQGHDYVDLGLSVMWATTNMGASAPQECGKSYYEFALSGSANDPAKKEWGGTWRLPTTADANELLSKCTVVPIDDGVDIDEAGSHAGLGWIVTGPNGNSIYFPVEEEQYMYGSCYYMIGERADEKYIKTMWFLYPSEYNITEMKVWDYYGTIGSFLVRPVFKK